ncbi:MAG TPA: UDP-N-acetylglucosamine 1-carboxyvinyltransferase [Trueperaceae bacterium]|nr:UDP-N-acetylglucosamine 1-carboxyvinyltransferase [Trueperaceae bacterium]
MTDTNDVLIIRGGTPLRGKLPVFRAKNSALYLIFASLLTDEEVILEDVPRLSDVLVSEEILRHVGVDTSWHGHELRLHAANIRTCNAPYGLVSKMRASFVIMGALLGRCGEAVVPMPGGCAFGPRPVDRHLSALREIGVVIDEEGGEFHARKTRAFGGTAHFEAPTVGGTQNLMLASVLGAGTVVIDNAALEPEVADLANMLNAMGADVQGAGTSTITVHAVPRLSGVRYRPIADRIEAGTYLLAVAASRGHVTLTDLEPHNLAAVMTALQATGVKVSANADSLSIDATGPLNATDIDAREYPGVPTDLQAPFSAFLATVDGVSNLRDHVYPDRFTHVEELARTGARLRLDERSLEIRGGPLKGAAMHAADIRAGGALIVAAVAAKGTSEIGGLKFIDRGYERFAERLSELGADVIRQSAVKLTATGTFGAGAASNTLLSN